MDVEVPGGEIRWFGPFDSYAGIYRVAEVVRFEELQELRIVPGGLSEQEALDALVADETAFREARNRAQAERHRCSCQDAASHHAEPRNRERQHTNLASVLRLSYPRALATDDPEVQHVYHHLRRWFSKPARYLLGVASPQNIVIGVDGTLVMSPTVHVVHANLIQLSSNSRLRFESGSVNVYCETLTGPSEPSPPSPGSSVPPVWPPPDRPNPLDPNNHLRNVHIGKYLRGYSREFDVRIGKE
jgi:hypothetical protein